MTPFKITNVDQEDLVFDKEDNVIFCFDPYGNGAGFRFTNREQAQGLINELQRILIWRLYCD